MERKKNGELIERRLHSLYYFVKYHRSRFLLALPVCF